MRVQFYYGLKPDESPLRQKIESAPDRAIKYVGEHVDNEDPEKPIIGVYSVNLGLFRRSSTIEVSDKVTAMKRDYYGGRLKEGTLRIIGTESAIIRTKEKLEDMFSLKLNMAGIREATPALRTGGELVTN